MTVDVERVDGLPAQLTAARTLAPGLELHHIKSSVRSRLFGAGEPTVVGGHTIHRLIGRGGMGAVYEASDERGELVALKTLHGFDPAALFRLKQEFRALVDLDHPNLVGLHHLVADGDQVFVTMESVEGRDFLAEVQAGTPLAALLPQLVAGVAALHAAGKLHRDLKPANVLVTPAGRVVILDFGLIHNWGDPRGELVGTPAYMAPELLLGAAPSPASDWYSVGVMIHEALSGRLPFPGDGFEVLHAKLAVDPPRLTCPDQTLAGLCHHLLARDPGRRASLRDILRALGSPHVSTIVRHPRDLALIGRAPELAALHAALASVHAGEPVVVLVRGDSGVGKTTLVQAFLDGLGPGVVVLCGRCYEREQVPHNAFDSLVDALTGHLLRLSAADQTAALTGDIAALAHLFPVLRRLPAVAAAHAEMLRRGPEDMPFGTALLGRAYATLRAIFAHLGARAPLVLHIDDLQWADGDSAVLLAELAAAAIPGCLLIAGLGEDADGPGPVVARDLLHRLAALQRLRELRLAPLSPADAVALARVLLDPRGSTHHPLRPVDPLEPLADPPDPAALAAAAAAVARESDGLPLFIHELVHHHREHYLSARTGPRTTATPPAPALDPAIACRLDDLIAVRTARLPPAARELLTLLAVAARPLPAAFAVRLVAESAVGHAALRQLRVARLVRTRRTDRGEQVELYHDRIREAVAASLDARRLRACHGRLAEVLADSEHADPDMLAQHLRAAGQTDRARAAMLAAARQAARTLAFHRAAELLLKTLDLSPMTDAAGRRALRIEAGAALAHAGRGDEAANCLLAAAAGAPPLQALDLRRRAAETLLDAGAVTRGLAQLDEVLVALGLRIPRSRTARAIRLAAEQLRLRMRGLEFTPRRDAEIDEATLVRLDALRLARVALVQHDPLAGQIYQLELLRRTLDVGEPGRIIRSLAAHAAYLSHAGHRGADESARLLDRARALILRHDVPDAAPLVALFAGMRAHNCGDWRTALAHLDAAGLPLANIPSSSLDAVARALLVGLCGVWALGSLFHLGDLHQLAARRQVFVDLLRHLGDAAGEARLILSWQVFAALADDDPDTAQRELSAATRRWSPEAFPYERALGTLATWATLVYAGDGHAAWHRVIADWPALTASFLYSGQQGRVSAQFWRGAAALRSARTAADPRPQLAAAEAAQRTIADERVRWAEPLAHVLRAGVTAHHHPGLATGALALAVAGLDAHDMHLWAAAARYQAARLTGDVPRRDAAAARMSELGVTNPARMAACLVPIG